MIALHLAAPAWAQDHISAAAAVQSKESEAAKALANPLAALISVPMQYNYDKFGGANDGASVNRLNIQPVIPISLNDDWNLISRTIVPFIDQRDFPDTARNKSGLGDITASLFFSPKAPTAGGWIWGVGPVFLLPTATQDVLGAQKWGLGPTGVALTQTGPWTVGMLANHIWGGAGSGPTSVNATFLQPFVSYTTATTHTTLSMNTESTYDWEAKQWSVPLNFQVGQVFKLGTQLLQITAGARYWADTPANGTDGWGGRLQLTLLFPK